MSIITVYVINRKSNKCKKMCRIPFEKTNTDELFKESQSTRSRLSNFVKFYHFEKISKRCIEQPRIDEQIG